MKKNYIALLSATLGFIWSIVVFSVIISSFVDSIDKSQPSDAYGLFISIALMPYAISIFLASILNLRVYKHNNNAYIKTAFFMYLIGILFYLPIFVVIPIVVVAMLPFMILSAIAGEISKKDNAVDIEIGDVSGVGENNSPVLPNENQ